LPGLTAPAIPAASPPCCRLSGFPAPRLPYWAPARRGVPRYFSSPAPLPPCALPVTAPPPPGTPSPASVPPPRPAPSSLAFAPHLAALHRCAARNRPLAVLPPFPLALAPGAALPYLFALSPRARPRAFPLLCVPTPSVLAPGPRRLSSARCCRPAHPVTRPSLSPFRPRSPTLARNPRPELRPPCGSSSSARAALALGAAPLLAWAPFHPAGARSNRSGLPCSLPVRVPRGLARPPRLAPPPRSRPGMLHPPACWPCRSGSPPPHGSTPPLLPPRPPGPPRLFAPPPARPDPLAPPRLPPSSPPLLLAVTCPPFRPPPASRGCVLRFCGSCRAGLPHAPRPAPPWPLPPRACAPVAAPGGLPPTRTLVRPRRAILAAVPRLAVPSSPAPCPAPPPGPVAPPPAARTPAPPAPRVAPLSPPLGPPPAPGSSRLPAPPPPPPLRPHPARAGVCPSPPCALPFPLLSPPPAAAAPRALLATLRPGGPVPRGSACVVRRVGGFVYWCLAPLPAVAVLSAWSIRALLTVWACLSLCRAAWSHPAPAAARAMGAVALCPPLSALTRRRASGVSGPGCAVLLASALSLLPVLPALGGAWPVFPCALH